MTFDDSQFVTKRLCFLAMGPGAGPSAGPEGSTAAAPEQQPDVQQLQEQRAAEKQAVQTDTAGQLQNLAQETGVDGGAAAAAGGLAEGAAAGLGEGAEAAAAAAESAEGTEGAAEEEPAFDTGKLDAVDRVLGGPADSLFNNPGYDETNIASLQNIVLETAKRPSPIDAWGRENGLGGALDASRQATMDALQEGGFL